VIIGAKLLNQSMIIGAIIPWLKKSRAGVMCDASCHWIET
jgi:hypothetical protein